MAATICLWSSSWNLFLLEKEPAKLPADRPRRSPQPIEAQLIVGYGVDWVNSRSFLGLKTGCRVSLPTSEFSAQPVQSNI